MNKSVKDLGKIFGVSINKKWDEAYELFNELEAAGERDFATGGVRTSKEVYNEMMRAASETLLLDDFEYESSPDEVTNAVIYSVNSDVSRKEFRVSIKQVLEGEKKWEYFAH